MATGYKQPLAGGDDAYRDIEDLLQPLMEHLERNRVHITTHTWGLISAFGIACFRRGRDVDPEGTTVEMPTIPAPDPADAGKYKIRFKP